MSEAANYPNFHQPVEGQPPLSAEQLTDTSQAYNRLFDDLMLQGMHDVKRFGTIKVGFTANLQKRIVADGQTYSLLLEDKSPREPDSEAIDITFRDSEITTRLINLQRIDEGFGREHWSYRLGADGIVRRWDNGDYTARKRKDRELGIEGPKMPSSDEPIGEIGRVILAELRNLTEELPNRRLAEDMGLNNQPVAPDEIQGLQDFLARATEAPE